MRSRLDQIEARLQKFIESSLYLLPGSKRPALLIHHLIQALEQTIVTQVDGNLMASNHYVIYLHPENATDWQSNPELLPALSRVLEEAASESGLHFSTSPDIELCPDLTQPIDGFKITSSLRHRHVDQTSALPVDSQPEPAEIDSRPLASFVIINNQTIPLRMAVMNLGRREDNQLVVNDPRVSRVHAQLRAIHGKYTLFDLNSTGGTYINGLRISQQVLKPGDVISLAGFPVIYGEESIPPHQAIEDTHDQTLT